MLQGLASTKVPTEVTSLPVLTSTRPVPSAVSNLPPAGPLPSAPCQGCVPTHGILTTPRGRDENKEVHGEAAGPVHAAGRGQLGPQACPKLEMGV